MTEARRFGPFEVVEDGPEVPGQKIAAPPRDRATEILLLALKTFSQKTVHALESCFSLITVALVFLAAYPILTATPTVNQLIGLGVFSVFVLIANWLVLKRRS